MVDENNIQYREHFNLPQLLAFAVNPNLLVGEWGRGTGKSTGLVAGRMLHCAKVMPRMAGTFLAPSYRKFMDHMWPGIRKGWTEKFKLVEGRDFVFLKRPPDNWKFANGSPARPYMSPGSFDHFISFRNGSGWHIISFDHGQTSNALDTDANITDEAKLIDGEKAQEEVYNTLRGNRDHFGHLAEHYSKWIVSDKFTKEDSKQTRWFGDYKALHTKNKIEEILLTLIAINTSSNPKLISHLKDKLTQLQKEAVFYSEASTVENIHAVGIEYIEQLAKTNTAYGLLTSVFNMDVKRMNGSRFYPLFSEYKHAYDASDNDRVDDLIRKVGFDDYLSEQSCALDRDIVKNEKLYFFYDPGGTFNWGLIGQLQGNTFRFLKDFMVEKPKKAKDLIKDITNYYRDHPRKRVRIYWGVDADNETYDEKKTVIEKIFDYFREDGWEIEDAMATVKTISHSLKYRFGELIYDTSSKRDQRFPMVMMNRSNCHRLIWSVSEAKLVPGEIKYKKDKRGEKNAKLIQWQQTHFSDAHDWLIVDYLDLLQGDSGYGTPIVYK